MTNLLEPWVLHGWFERRAKRDPAGTLRLVSRMHWVLTTLAVATVAGAAAGAHGLLPTG